MKNLSKQAWASLCLLCTAMLLSASFVACSDGNSSENSEKPDTPVNPSDYQTVPTSGTTLKNGDITIVFPNNTFSEETKVAITELKKGDVLGDNEVSKFYQLTIPPRFDKPLTISIQCSETGPGINVVAHAPSYQLSEDILTYSNILLASSDTDGTYSFTMPATNNGSIGEDDIKEGETLTISFGVAKVEYCGSEGPSQARTTRTSDFSKKFTEGNVSWHFNIDDSFKKKHNDKLILYWDSINVCIRDAIKILHDLGLEITKRDIPFSFVSMDDKYGAFEQSAVFNEWSSVEISTRTLENFTTARADFRSTIIHELMHMYQADYDPRWAFRKADKIGTVTENVGSWIGSESVVVHDGSERLLLYESGAVWAEQFMIGHFNSDYAGRFLKDYIKGFYAIDKIYSSGTTHGRYEGHGYGASTLMQYITRHMTTYKLNDKSIADLYKIWHDTNGTAKSCIQQLTRNAGRDVFAAYDDYMLSLIKGEIDKDLTILNVVDGDLPKIDDKNLTRESIGTCYPYGCQINRFLVTISEEYPLETSQIVIEQLEGEVGTYVIIPEGGLNNKTFRQYGYKALKDSPIVIEGAELKQKFFTKERGSTYFTLYTVSSSMFNIENVPYKVKVDVKPISGKKMDVKSLALDGKLKYKYTYERKDDKVITDNINFEVGEIVPQSLLKPGNKYTTFVSTLDGSTLHVVANQNIEAEEIDAISGATDNINGTNRISFDIENFAPDYTSCRLKNFKMDGNATKKVTERGGVTDWKAIWEYKVSYIPFYQVNSTTGGNISLRFYATVKGGLKVESSNISLEREHTSNPGVEETETSMKKGTATYINTNDNYLDIQLELMP